MRSINRLFTSTPLAVFGDADEGEGLGPVEVTQMTGTPPEQHGGHRVVRIDPANRQVEKFFGQKGHGHGGGGGHASGDGHGEKEESVTAGPRRLVDVRFAPAGDALYVWSTSDPWSSSESRYRSPRPALSGASCPTGPSPPGRRRIQPSSRWRRNEQRSRSARTRS